MSLKNENIKLDIAQTQKSIKLQMLNANTNISNSIKNLDINKQNLELAKNILNICYNNTISKRCHCIF